MSSPSSGRVPHRSADPASAFPLRTSLLVMAVAALVRLAWSRLYGPVVEGDADWYVLMARWLSTGQFRLLDDGARPPFYPLLLLAGGIRPPVVQGIQGLLGTATTGLVFALVWRATGRTRWATFAGLVQALSPDALGFEAYLVTESSATFLLTVIGALLIAVRERPTVGRAAALAVAISLSALNKTFHLYLVPFAILALTWPRARSGRRRSAGPAVLAAFVVPVTLIVGAWCVWEWQVHGVFTPSTQTGFRLTQHVGNRMELAPDRYTVLRDIYLAHRTRMEAETGSHVNTIWAAVPDMQRATGLSYARLSREVQAMSVAVMRADPANYGRSVLRAWVLSWSRPMYVKPGYARSPALGATLARAAAVVRPLFLLLNAAFLAIAAALTWPGLRARLPAGGDVPLLAAMIVTGTVVAALGELSDNGKFAAPFMPLVLVCVTVMLARLWRPARS